MVHATTSFLKQVYPQISKALQHGVNVVSTCEELAYPYATEPELAHKLDELAKENGVTVLGTGINPGFLMDTLVITLTGVCQKIERIRATRTINAATRRGPFQKKIGVGLSIEEFRDGIERKIITGHIGLKESIFMIADALGWKMDRIEVDPVEPVVANAHNRVAGLKQHARGSKKGKEVITLDFQAYMGAEEYDSITIEGVPSIHMKIAPCIHGDIGTAAIVVNSIPKVINAQPGLVTMKDLTIPSAALNDMRKYIIIEHGDLYG
jgi:4-hydroxy-tetrahydrodipicolinate reductase